MGLRSPRCAGGLGKTAFPDRASGKGQDKTPLSGGAPRSSGRRSFSRRGVCSSVSTRCTALDFVHELQGPGLLSNPVPTALPPRLGPSRVASLSTQRALGFPPPPSRSAWMSSPGTVPCFVLPRPTLHGTAGVHCPCSHQSEFCSQLYEQHRKPVPRAQKMLNTW